MEKKRRKVNLWDQCTYLLEIRSQVTERRRQLTSANGLASIVWAAASAPTRRARFWNTEQRSGFLRGREDSRTRTWSWLCQRRAKTFERHRQGYTHSHSRTFTLCSHYVHKHLISVPLATIFSFEGPQRILHFVCHLGHYFIILYKLNIYFLFIVKKLQEWLLNSILLPDSLLLLNVLAPNEFGVFWYWPWSYC